MRSWGLIVLMQLTPNLLWHVLVFPPRSCPSFTLFHLSWTLSSGCVFSWNVVPQTERSTLPLQDYFGSEVSGWCPAFSTAKQYYSLQSGLWLTSKVPFWGTATHACIRSLALLFPEHVQFNKVCFTPRTLLALLPAILPSSCSSLNPNQNKARLAHFF